VLLTRAPLPLRGARLACVRPAASVRSEPGSNSQVRLQIQSACADQTLLLERSTPVLRPRLHLSHLSHPTEPACTDPILIALLASEIPRPLVCASHQRPNRRPRIPSPLSSNLSKIRGPSPVSRASEPHPPAAPSPFKGRPARAEVVISFTEAAFATFFSSAARRSLRSLSRPSPRRRRRWSGL
jgi:hypothetical protein